MVFNLSQGVESFVLAYLGEKEFEKAAIYGVSTLLSTAVGDIGMGWFSGSQAEKFVSEPIVAGIISGVGLYLFKKREKDRYFSPFARGFCYTGASAGLNSVLAANYIGLPKEITVVKKGESFYDQKYGTGQTAAVDIKVPVADSYAGLRAYNASLGNTSFGSSNMVL